MTKIKNIQNIEKYQKNNKKNKKRTTKVKIKKQRLKILIVYFKLTI